MLEPVSINVCGGCSVHVKATFHTPLYLEVAASITEQPNPVGVCEYANGGICNQAVASNTMLVPLSWTREWWLERTKTF